MGLDAVVRCRCWEEGRLASPPPSHAHVHLDPGDDRLVLGLPWAGHEEEHKAFGRWLETCCPHAEMEYADEWIASWGGLRAFQGQLAELGLEQFPTLRDVLPNANGGLVPPERSAAALAELDDFARRDLGSRVVLVDAATGEALHEYVPAYGGCFHFGPPGWQGGVDADGFFVRGPSSALALLARLAARPGGPRQTVVRRSPQGWTVTRPARDPVSRLRAWLVGLASRAPAGEKFRSMAFTQERVGAGAYRFTDERTGDSFVSPFGVSKLGSLEGAVYPARLAVERRRREAGAFDYILRPLRVVFRASVETGNPVRWC